MTDLATQLDEARERIRLLEAELGLHDPLPAALGLTFTEERLLATILKRPVATYGLLYLALPAVQRGAEPHPQIIRVHVCAMRKKLARFGVAIRVRSGEGYRIEEADKAKLRSLVHDAMAA